LRYANACGLIRDGRLSKRRRAQRAYLLPCEPVRETIIPFESWSTVSQLFKTGDKRGENRLRTRGSAGHMLMLAHKQLTIKDLVKLLQRHHLNSSVAMIRRRSVVLRDLACRGNLIMPSS
jgi:hypothetical protein